VCCKSWAVHYAEKFQYVAIALHKDLCTLTGSYIGINLLWTRFRDYSTFRTDFPNRSLGLQRVNRGENTDLKNECLVEDWVEGFPVYFGLIFLLLVGHDVDLDVRI